MRFGNQSYAAKKFYNIGKGLAPSLQENEDHLKDELICLQSIASAVQRFSEQAKSSKIFIYGNYYRQTTPWRVNTYYQILF